MIFETETSQVLDRIEMERVVKKGEIKLKYYIDKSPDGIFVLNGKGYFTDVNPAGCSILGYSREEVLELHLSDIDKGIKSMSRFNQIKFSGEIIDEERILTRKDGKNIIAHIKSVSLENDWYISYVRDITDRKETEKALVEAERRFELYVDKSPDGIFVVDGEGRYIDVNPAACSMLGYSRKELLCMRIIDLDVLEVSNESFQTLKETGELLKQETVLISKDGNHLSVELRAVSLGNGLYMAYVTDITERKLAEVKLSESEKLFSMSFHSNPNAMAVSTFPEGRFIDVNTSFLKLHEYSREEVIGRTSYELNIWPDSEKRRNWVRILEKGGQIKNFDIDIYSKSGIKFTGLYCLELIELGGKKCTLGCFNDLTEKKKVEMEIVRLDRLNLIGEMSASIGHEVRNPMTTVRGFLQLLGSGETDIRKQQYYELMIEELDRANSIITEFLSLAKDKSVKLQPMSLNSLINTLYPLLSSDAIKQDKIIMITKGEIPDVSIDDKEMRQLIINLVKNGLEAMPSGGILTIGTYSKNNEVVLFVEDEGPGIGTEILDKLGNPFVTTKDNGTGLGLPVCYSIANRHNATIDFQTGPSGTTFYVRFRHHKSVRNR